MDYKDARLTIAKNIGEPINPSLPVPVELAEICNLDTANPGERVWRFDDIDTRVDVILAMSDSNITQVKVSPLADAEITFSDLDSEQIRVNVRDVLKEVDFDVLGRKKARLSHGLDKRELKIVLDLILARTALGESSIIPTATLASGDDVYDIITNMKEQLEDYGTDYILLEGITVRSKIDSYDKDKAATFNYNVNLKGKLTSLGIKEVKIFGVIGTVTGTPPDPAIGTGTRLLDANKLIMVARNSRIAGGKPITFVRRKITADLAEQMGADVDNAQRALWIAGAPTRVSTNDVLAYSVYSFESYALAIVNPYAICVTADISSYL